MSSKSTVYSKKETPANKPKEAKLKAQGEHLDYWNEKFEKMIHDMKVEIMKVIDG